MISPQQNSRLMLIILKMENIFDYYWRKRYAFNPFPTPLPYDLLRTISINVALYTPLRLRNLRLSPDVHFSWIRFGLLASNVTPIVKKISLLYACRFNIIMKCSYYTNLWLFSKTPFQANM